MLFFLELLVVGGLEGFVDARWTDPAGAEAADVELALLDDIFVLGEGGEECGLIGCAGVVVGVGVALGLRVVLGILGRGGGGVVGGVVVCCAVGGPERGVLGCC